MRGDGLLFRCRSLHSATNGRPRPVPLPTLLFQERPRVEPFGSTHPSCRRRTPCADKPGFALSPSPSAPLPPSVAVADPAGKREGSPSDKTGGGRFRASIGISGCLGLEAACTSPAGHDLIGDKGHGAVSLPRGPLLPMSLVIHRQLSATYRARRTWTFHDVIAGARPDLPRPSLTS